MTLYINLLLLDEEILDAGEGSNSLKQVLAWYISIFIHINSKDNQMLR